VLTGGEMEGGRRKLAEAYVCSTACCGPFLLCEVILFSGLQAVLVVFFPC